ncbi:MAG: MBL fold metallo-hydrolase [Pseudomonadota bacterium]
MTKPIVTPFFDEATFTVTYVVIDPATRQAAIIDSVLDFDLASGKTSTDSADAVISHCKAEALDVRWILETHVHADHLSAGHYLAGKLDATVAIGEKVPMVQGVFASLFNLPDISGDGREFDRLLADGDTIDIGETQGRVRFTPGHTPACVTYVFGDAAFVGDTLFMPDFGTARTDFPGGSAGELYDSIRGTLSLDPATRLYMCHDYKAPGRDHYAWETSVAEQLADNIHINDSVSRNDFIALREGRDAELGVPKLLLPAVQFNLRVGKMPPAEDNGIRYLKIPLNSF